MWFVMLLKNDYFINPLADVKKTFCYSFWTLKKRLDRLTTRHKPYTKLSIILCYSPPPPKK